MPAELHFLRPWWLLALLPALAGVAWLALRTGTGGAWAGVIAPALQRALLVGGDERPPWRRAALPALAAVLAVLALAGPAWERAPQPTWAGQSALVLVLDMSHSMNATDVSPSRLERAKLKIRDILQRRPADQIGLVVYTANAFTVTPLTTDTRNIELMLEALTTDIMPSQGSFAHVGLNKGAELILQTGLPAGDLLLITDQTDGEAGRRAAAELAAKGLRVSVLAVGTAGGAPIPQPDGGFLRSPEGRIVVPQMREGPMRALAASGHGRFARLSADDADLDHLLSPVEARGAAAGGAGAGASDVEALLWVDRGPWLALLLVPLALLAFRRGVVLPLLAAAVLVPPPAHALEWRDLLSRPDQRALQALERDDPEAAARLFADPQWRAAALYRAGRYAESARELEGLDAIPALYNRGNALARAGELDAAIQAYDRVLARAPDHEDAAYNRDLVLALREEQEQADADGDPDGDAGDGPPEPPDGAPDRPSGAEEGRADGDPQLSDEAMPGSPDDGDGEAGDVEGTLPPDPATLAQLTEEEIDQAMEQWLRRVPDDPGGLLRRKFEQQYRRQGVDQDGNPTWPGDEQQPW